MALAAAANILPHAIVRRNKYDRERIYCLCFMRQSMSRRSHFNAVKMNKDEYWKYNSTARMLSVSIVLNFHPAVIGTFPLCFKVLTWNLIKSWEFNKKISFNPLSILIISSQANKSNEKSTEFNQNFELNPCRFGFLATMRFSSTQIKRCKFSIRTDSNHNRSEMKSNKCVRSGDIKWKYAAFFHLRTKIACFRQWNCQFWCYAWKKILCVSPHIRNPLRMRRESGRMKQPANIHQKQVIKMWTHTQTCAHRALKLNDEFDFRKQNR